MTDNTLSEGLRTAPPLWVQTEEDADTTLFALGPAVRGSVLCIASGGDTPLALVAGGAQEVIAADINPSQIALAELKARSVESLDLPSLETFWMGHDAARRMALYQSIKATLNATSRRFLDSWLASFDSQAFIEQGQMQGVGSELRQRDPTLAGKLTCWFQTRTLPEQRTYHDQHLQPLAEAVAALRQARAERWFGSDGGESDARVAQEMRERFKQRFQHLVAHIPVARNPYAAHLMLGAYPPDARPPYLTATGQVRARQSGRIRFVAGDLREVAASLPAASLAGIDLSNIADLLSEDEVARLFRTLTRVLRPGGRVVHRNLIWQEPYAVADGFTRDVEQSRGLTERDRSFVYSAVTVDSLSWG
ncbi:DUF3419 family protein [uncultured Lamprocystis sp.]|jgi:S-adenosylmethionine:diacylglycerol 3-amino-3-carboxypropyl transferase|uniref:DUF3419 family protein n=1 Tax=uncultured Lamprocystis sp. TaxID=543132 RepID=UPI0025F2A645|nr:DUF3419 family protein [uncultured Lamprocystis sp.]